MDAERVDENDPTKTTRKTTTPLVRERRDEECKHRGEGGEGRNGSSKTIITTPKKKRCRRRVTGVQKGEKDAVAQTYMLAHPVYDFGYIESIRPRHRQPQGARDYVSMFAVWSARKDSTPSLISQEEHDERRVVVSVDIFRDGSGDSRDGRGDVETHALVEAVETR